MAFTLVVRDNLLSVELTQDRITVHASEDNPGSFRLSVGGRKRAVSAGDVATMSTQP